MAFEVAEEGVVVGGEIADRVVEFRACVYERGGGMREAGEVAAELLGEDGLVAVRATPGVVELEGVVGASCEEEFACIVEIEGGDMG